MSVNTLRLAFAGVWLLVAVGLFAGGTGGGRSAEVGGLLAVAFALWNVARWRQARPRPATEPRRPRPTGDEYHPEFDFGGPPDRSPTR